MSNIDEVINRSRQGGTFRERKSFTVARNRAIQKMREFALVDPHYYILELIQSAVGNGATYIDIQADRNSAALSYIGGGFREVELAQLFDFLFASKDDVEHGPIRQLALGINALMNFEPTEIVIETGDGTLKGTTRVEIHGKNDTVDVGTPDQALKGTYIRATGMKRSKARSSALKVIDGHPREYHAVENRCITSPVPILFNHDPLFGYSSQRTPKSLYGFSKSISFDEGDFYGTIGVASRHSGATFRLVTHGVWIESVRNEMGARLGGVIAFDGLRKTADHSSIVQDNRYQEMWVRLRPYINQLLGKQGDGGYRVYTINGEQLSTEDLISLVRNFSQVLAIPRLRLEDQHFVERAVQVSETLDSPVIAYDSRDLEQLRVLAGTTVDLVTSDLKNDRVFRFYTSEEAPSPPSPWLIAPLDLESFDLLELGVRLPWPENEKEPNQELVFDKDKKESFSVRALRQCVWLLDRPVEKGQSPQQWKAVHLDPIGKNISARVYTPETGEDALLENAQVRVARREVWRGNVEGIAPGQVLVVDVANLTPEALWRRPKGELKGGRSLAEYIVELVVDGNRSALEDSANAGLRAALRSEVNPGTSAARLILSALTSRVVRRVHGEGGKNVIRFALIDQNLDRAVLEKPLLKTLDGQGCSLRDLDAMMEKTSGLLYGVRADVEADLKGLDRSLILDLEEIDESLVINLLGPGAYIRVDKRDILGEVNDVACRDIALGLKSYPSFPLLIEGGALDAWEEPAKNRACIELVAGLLKTVETRGSDWDLLENRRQAWRHLQYFALHRENFDFSREIDWIDELPLFALSSGETISAQTLKAAMKTQQKLIMLDGWAFGAAEQGLERALANKIDLKEGEEIDLAMDPFLLSVLGERVEGAASHELSPQEQIEVDEERPELFLESLVLEDRHLQGFIGVPREPVARKGVMLFETGGKTVLCRDLGERFHLVGKVRLRSQTREEAEKVLRAHGIDLLGRLVSRLPKIIREGDSLEVNRALEVLLSYACSHLHFHCKNDGSVLMDLAWDGLGREILQAPLFAAKEGLPLSPMALIRQFKRQAWMAISYGKELNFQPQGLAANQPEALDWFLYTYLRVERIQRPPSSEQRAFLSQESREEKQEERDLVVVQVEDWLNRLRPDLETWSDPEVYEQERFRVMADEAGEYFTKDLQDEFCLYKVTGIVGVGARKVLFLNPSHWLYEWVRKESGANPRSLAWAILAAYAHINNVEEPITNAHELVFQRRVVEALETGFAVGRSEV